MEIKLTHLAPAIITEMRQCKKCGKIKSTRDFYNGKKWKDGKSTNCKKCDCEEEKPSEVYFRHDKKIITI